MKTTKIGMSYESYGVIRCARNVRRRREARARFVRRVAWALLALAIVLALSGCEARAEVDRALIGVVLGLSTFLLVGLVWMAATEQARQDRLGEAYAEAEENDECRMPNDECGAPEVENDEGDPLAETAAGLDAEALRGITRALLLTAGDARESVRLATQHCSVEDYGEALAVAMRRLDAMIGCLQGLQERCQNTEARRAGA